MARMVLGRKMHQEQLAADSLRAAEKLSAVGRMASAMAHEIDNPLQSLTNLLFMVQVAEIVKSGWNFFGWPTRNWCVCRTG